MKISGNLRLLHYYSSCAPGLWNRSTIAIILNYICVINVA